MDHPKDFVDYYKVLDVPPNASLKDIKKAHRVKALKYHPDKNPDKAARQKFEEIQTAYDTLKDPEKKKAYDNILAAKLENIRRYEQQDKARQKLVTDLLQREKSNVESKMKERQKVQRDKYEAMMARKRLAEELQTESTKESKRDEKLKSTSILIKWRRGMKVSYTKESLRAIFGQYGRIDDVLLIPDKRSAYIVFAYKESALKVLNEKQKFAGEFRIKAVKDVEDKFTQPTPKPDAFLSTDVLNKMKMANEKRSFDTIKEQESKSKVEPNHKKKKVEDEKLSPEDFKKKEEEILKKLLEG